MLNDNTRLKVSDDVSFQSLGEGEQTVVLSLESGQLYTCNETARAFLEALQGGRTFAGALDRVEEQFEVDRDELSRDMLELANELMAEGLIVEQAEADD